MRKRGVIGCACGWVVLLAFGAGGAVARPAADSLRLQLFSTVDRRVVAVGEPFVLEIECLATPASPAARHRLERAFAAGTLREADPSVEVVRADPLLVEPLGEGPGIVRLIRRFVLRARQPGRLPVPDFEFRAEGARQRSGAREVNSYRVAPAFFRAARAVLPVVAETAPDERGQVRRRIGTGFLVADDRLVTGYHVMVDAARVLVFLPDGRRVSTRRVWAVDPARDVAVLHVDGRHARRLGLAPLKLAPGADAVAGAGPDAGSVVFTSGWPGGVQRSTAGVRFAGIRLGEETILVSANPVRPGDSGGPLLDPYGRVLGVVSLGRHGSRQADFLRENVTLSTDPAPAIAAARWAERPRSLRSLRRDPLLRREPHAEVLRLSAELARFPGPAARAASGARGELPAPPAARGPADAVLHFLRGSVYQMLGAHTHAAGEFQAALNDYAGYFPASYALGLYHLERRDYAEAGRFFEHTRRFEPFRHLASFGLAQTAVRAHRYEEARRHLETVLAYDPSYAPALHLLGFCLLAEGDEARARQLVAKLDRVDQVWAARLRRVVDNPVMHPVVPVELPRAELHFLARSPRPVTDRNRIGPGPGR